MCDTFCPYYPKCKFGCSSEAHHMKKYAAISFGYRKPKTTLLQAVVLNLDDSKILPAKVVESNKEEIIVDLSEPNEPVPSEVKPKKKFPPKVNSPKKSCRTVSEPVMTKSNISSYCNFSVPDISTTFTMKSNKIDYTKLMEFIQ